MSSPPLPIRIGYSCWGFLGKGVIDTPDGGRSHRLVLIEELIKQNAHLFMLQRNRDLGEAGENVARVGLTFDDTYPELDALFLEYRWPIPGRNVGVSVHNGYCCPIRNSRDNSSHRAIFWHLCDGISPLAGKIGSFYTSHSPLFGLSNSIHNERYTPDLARQNELIAHYSQQNIPLLIWDKDQKLGLPEQQLLQNRNRWVVVFEPAFTPEHGRDSLLFPLDEKKTQVATQHLAHYRKADRNTKLIYIGNQYERNESFLEFYDKPSATLDPPAHVYGKWDRSGEQTGIVFPHVHFHGRVGFQEVHLLYQGALVTVLIAPERYYASGHYTQRLFESVWGLCIPLVPSRYTYAEHIVPNELLVRDASDVSARIEWVLRSTDQQIALCLQTVMQNVQMFAANQQAEKIISAIRSVRQ